MSNKEQHLFFGQGELQKLPIRLEELQSRRVMLFHGSSSYSSSGARDVVESLREASSLDPSDNKKGEEIDDLIVGGRIAWSFYSDIPPNPEVVSIRDAYTRFRSFQPDTVIAVGGGSVIDTAKAVLAYSSGASEEELFSNNFSYPDKPLLPPNHPRFVVIPTTAGSGSESTHFAVVYKEKKKFSLAQPGMRPDVAILDPLCTLSCPKSVTLASGVDAVCQAIESHWNTFATTQSREYSSQALQLLLPAIFKVISHPQDADSRGNMLKGAHLAGRAINITKTTAAHAMSYGLTTMFGIPHGLAVLSVMQPLVQVMERSHHFFDVSEGGRQGVPFFDAPGVPFLDRPEDSAGAEHSFPETFDLFCEEVWKINPLTDYFSSLDPAHTADYVEELAAAVNVERLVNHPVTLTKEELKEVYSLVLERHK